MQIFTEKALIIDYGSALIKGALVELSAGRRRVLRLESLPVVNIRRDSGQDNDDLSGVSEYEYNLVRYVQSFFPDELNFVMVIPNDRVYVRDISVPASNLKQIAEIIPHEVESIAPVSLEEAEVIGQPWEVGEENASVLSFMATHESLEQAVAPLLRGNASIRMLTIDAPALAGFLNFLGPEGTSGTGIAQLDIGGRISIFNIVQNGKLAFTRQIPFGGEEITRLVGERLQLDPAAAEERKMQLELDLQYDERRADRTEAFYRRNRIDRKQYAALAKEIRAAFAELAEDVRRSVLAAPGGEVQAIYLSGGGSQLGGTASYLEDLLGVHVRQYPLELSNGEDPALWATALGAAEHYALKAPERFDFLRGAFGANLRGGKFNFSFFSTPAILSLGAIILFLAGFFLSIYKDTTLIRSYRQQIAELARGIPGMPSNGDPAAMRQAASKICMDRLQAVRGKSGGPRFVDFLKTLSELTPDRSAIDLRVNSVRYDGKTADIDVEVADLNQRQALAEALKRSSMFSDVKVEGQQQPNRRWRVIIKLSFNRAESSQAGSCG
ncbi:MAG: pilus assembly protein PilM [Leptospirales bacterium]|nr:pilus assembly protein PilM [Leptospirales bacterium]